MSWLGKESIHSCSCGCVCVWDSFVETDPDGNKTTTTKLKIKCEMHKEKCYWSGNEEIFPCGCVWDDFVEPYMGVTTITRMLKKIGPNHIQKSNGELISWLGKESVHSCSCGCVCVWDSFVEHRPEGIKITTKLKVKCEMHKKKCYWSDNEEIFACGCVWDDFVEPYMGVTTITRQPKLLCDEHIKNPN